MIRFVVLCLLLSVEAKHPVIDFAAEARRLVHQSIWASVGTTSTDASFKGYPFVTVVSMADSKRYQSSTGDIFFYMTDKDPIAKDVLTDNRISFMFTDAQEGGCTERGVDPWSHECHRAIILGQVAKLKAESEEYARGMEAFHSRHLAAATWISPDLNFYLCKLEISNILVFGGYGGYHHVSRDDYYRITTPTTTTEDYDPN